MDIILIISVVDHVINRTWHTQTRFLVFGGTLSLQIPLLFRGRFKWDVSAIFLCSILKDVKKWKNLKLVKLV